MKRGQENSQETTNTNKCCMRFQDTNQVSIKSKPRPTYEQPMTRNGHLKSIFHSGKKRNG